ncbi:MAG: alpha/beta hydrolase [Bryobacteraceae bacterium]
MIDTLAGTVRLHNAFCSRFVKEPRDVIVYVPPDYNSERSRRYPVLYLHDGQNLFDPATAFNHNEWGVDKVADQLILDGEIEPLIIVGIYNSGSKRMSEYTHVSDYLGRGGLARNYGKMIASDLKPFIDREYRTLTDSVHTGLGGSSLGGLVTMYLGLRYPEVFGKLIVMSPSVWWANRDILKKVHRAKHKGSQKIWLDVGTCEGSDPQSCLRNVEDLRDALMLKGWRLGYDLEFLADEGAGHDEKAWGARIGQALKFSFPAVPVGAPVLASDFR